MNQSYYISTANSIDSQRELTEQELEQVAAGASGQGGGGAGKVSLNDISFTAQAAGAQPHVKAFDGRTG